MLELTNEFKEAMFSLDLDSEDEEDVARFLRDQKCCNCDMDDPCYNIECRARQEQTREYYARLFSNPIAREVYKPVYGYEGGIRYKIDYSDD